MPKIEKVTYECDMCGTDPNANGKDSSGYYTVDYHEIRSPSFVPAIYEYPQSKPIFCSLTCVARAFEWYLNEWKADHADNSD